MTKTFFKVQSKYVHVSSSRWLEHTSTFETESEAETYLKNLPAPNFNYEYRIAKYQISSEIIKEIPLKK